MMGPLVIIGQIFHQQRWAHLSPSVISLVKNAGPIQSHRYVHFPIVLGPLEIIEKILPATPGPLVIVGQIFHQKRWAHLSPSVIFLVKNAGPIQSHRCVHSPIVLGPLEIIDKIPPATLGPLVIIGQIFHWQRCAHLSPSVISLVKNAGPMQSHRYVHFPIVLGPLEIIDKISPATLGPLVIIGQIFHHQRWAHLSPSVRSLPNHTGPIGDHRQNIPLAMLGPLETIGATIVNNDGPTGDYRPNIPLATLGPFEPIGNIPCEECWAHSKPSVRSLPNHTGPIGDHRQNSTGNAGPIGDRRPNIPLATLGPLETIGATIVKNDGPTGDYRPNIPPATLGPFEPIGNIPCEECWAHSKPSVRSLPNRTGPIGDHRKNSTGNAGPIGDRRPNIPPETLGPFEPIGNIPCEECWAHSKPSVRSLPNRTGPIGDHRQNSTGNTGPIGDHRPNIPLATLGPFEPIGNIPCEECWAHSKPSVRSLPNHTGPIGDHRQNIPLAMLGPLETIGATIVNNDGPTGDYRPNIPLATLGPFEPIGNIPCEECWAHSKPSVRSLPNHTGPIGDHRQNSTGNAGPIGDRRPNIPPATLGPLEPIGNIPCEECWANSKPSARSLPNHTGPIGDHRQNFTSNAGPIGDHRPNIPPHQQRWAHLSPSVISHVKNAGPIQSHRYVHFQIVLGPLEIIDKILPATLGPLTIIGQIFHQKRWAHLSPSVISLVKNAGPIQSHRYVHFPIVLGPLEIIDKISLATLGLLVIHRPNIPPATLGPFEPIGNIPCEECWAHSKPSVRSLPNRTGPIGDHRQNSTGITGPIGDHRPNIPPATLGPFEPFGSIPCEECWAHSKPSVRSLPNRTGPIGYYRQNIPPATLGLSEAIDSIPSVKCRAHSKPSVGSPPKLYWAH